ncbi:uncharacterized protein LOC111276653 isoform X2 [Durio zibethinus]|uniref:Uncharacterized protein LOC111276653 isoform X2 n=1 Tax=Durio zibethinus TaxID=66656 RepID=A0A6P5WPT4_DURZI|nr:uncharacterized protein LOC111276653 isoform X2 [Durio zibethinus]
MRKLLPFYSLGRKRRFSLQRKHKRNNAFKNMNNRFRLLKAETEEISREQKSIKAGQSQVQEKFKAIGKECEELKREVNVVMRQSALTHLRLHLMFNIFKAREDGDLAKAAHLTHLLREI